MLLAGVFYAKICTCILSKQNIILLKDFKTFWSEVSRTRRCLIIRKIMSLLVTSAMGEV